MAKALRRFPGNVYQEFPDDDSNKTLIFQADGQGLGDQYAGNPTDRHVMLSWNNEVDDRGSIVTQLIHLTGNPGNYAFYSLQARKCSISTFTTNLHIQLGTYTRAQRDRILELAAQVQFYKHSVTNNCQVWMRDLLESLVNDGLLTEGIFTYLNEKIPLLRRVVEEE